MSFDSTLTLTNAAAESESFVKLNSDSTKCVYALSSATLQEPVLLQIAHTMTQSREGSDRHLVKLSLTALDTDNRPFTEVWNVSMSSPRVGISQTHRNDILARVKSFLTEANLAKVMRGELA